MTSIGKMIDKFYFILYDSSELPIYIGSVKELMTYTGLRKADIVYRINTSTTNHLQFIVNHKLIKIYYFL